MIKHPGLLERHKAYIARRKENGAPTRTYSTPCCGQELEDHVPPDDSVWDTLSTCPYCGELYMKVSYHDHIVGLVPEED